MDKEKQLVSSSEQEILICSILDLLNSCEFLPDEIKEKGIIYYDLEPDVSCIGIATINSPIISQRFVGGSYIGEYNFRICYRYTVSNPEDRLVYQSLVTSIGEWLEKRTVTTKSGDTYRLENYPFVSDSITISKMEQTSRNILIDKNNSGYEDTIVDIKTTYHKKYNYFSMYKN